MPDDAEPVHLPAQGEVFADLRLSVGLLDDVRQAGPVEEIPGRSHLPYIGDSGPLTSAIRRFLGLPGRHRGAAPSLTTRQREVAALIAQGCTNREIGERLHITERSAEAHVERIRYRMDFRSRAQIAAWYVATAGAVVN